MKKILIEVFSHNMLENLCKINGLNDNNVEDTDIAFIDIIGTEECLKHYLEEDTTHCFSKPHSNVLNLEFDDLPNNDVLFGEHLFSTMRIGQAEIAIDFIEHNILESDIKTFRIACRAGFSRSRAFAEFIFRYCAENGIEVEYSEREDYIQFYNPHVLNLLNNAYWKKNKINGYENGEDYPNEFIDIRVFETNDN